MPYNYALIVLAAIGILNAGYLYWQHVKLIKANRAMVCLFNQKCEVVVESRWGKMLGIKNELWGIAFYLTILALSLWQIMGSDFPRVNELILFLSLSAALSSTYLLIIQFTILKNFCSWCIFSAVINYLIFITAVFLIL